jgi:hypothetical protein
MTEPTPLSDKALDLQRRIDELTAQLPDQDEQETEGRNAIIEQIEILKAELAAELPPGTEPQP